MARRFAYGTVRKNKRRAIHVLKVDDSAVVPEDITEITARMSDRLLARDGESFADVVVALQRSRFEFDLFGAPDAIARVRPEMTDLRWQPITLEQD